jgi:predicted amino acid racemase
VTLDEARAMVRKYGAAAQRQDRAEMAERGVTLVFALAQPPAREALQRVLAAVQIRHEFTAEDVRQIAREMGVEL